MRPKTEKLAMEMYDFYCVAVGGVAFNGDPLPKSEEFFADESKAKQVNAWLAVAGHVTSLVAGCSKEENKVPVQARGLVSRRHDESQWSEVEHSISNALKLVEGMGANPMLTEASVALSHAQDVVAEYLSPSENAESVTSEEPA